MLGEGAGILILENLDHALSREASIYAEIIRYGHSSDAHNIVQPEPGASGLVAAINEALDDAGIHIKDISYINVHGTSTELNDKAEVKAFKAVFGNKAYEIPISSTKSIIRHSLGAAAGIESIAVSLSIKHGFIHPTIIYRNKDSKCDLDFVPNKMRKQKLDKALKTSLGFGGHNAAILFSAYGQEGYQ